MMNLFDTGNIVGGYEYPFHMLVIRSLEWNMAFIGRKQWKWKRRQNKCNEVNKSFRYNQKSLLFDIIAVCFNHFFCIVMIARTCLSI